MRAGINSQLSQILVFSTDLKRIQTPHRFKFQSKFEPLPVIWQSLPEAILEENQRF